VSYWLPFNTLINGTCASKIEPLGLRLLVSAMLMLVHGKVDK
jgi:hypothetical protein